MCWISVITQPGRKPKKIVVNSLPVAKKEYVTRKTKESLDQWGTLGWYI
jgi:hypothetical protein